MLFVVMIQFIIICSQCRNIYQEQKLNARIRHLKHMFLNAEGLLNDCGYTHKADGYFGEDGASSDEEEKDA
jgi:hypothetical protein